MSTLAFDPSGNLYGTTSQCGSGKYGAGTLFELTPVGDGTWQEAILYNFCPKSDEGCPSGGQPKAGVTLDEAGNIYLTTEFGGGFNGGTVSEFSLGSNGQWTESVLHSFGSALGSSPVASVAFDQSGNLYGTAAFGETGGSLFRMAQNAQGWNYSALPFSITNGAFPVAPVLIDGQGSTLYGTASEGGEQQVGTVYKAHGKEITALYSFCSQPNCADGEEPKAGLVSDGSAHLYGTASRGGPYGEGVVFEIAP
ncbi:MAG TPA: choice-of-anchor tandem repeat GloVer-containing protein [Terriglobales bacterium]|nr:choice-of-anchor tandem repeat GloVer-containing protein [Terriglobales bacterium]